MTATAPITLDSVLEAAHKLPIDDQYALYSQLEAELHGSDSDDFELSKEWEEELNRRVAEVEAGTAVLIPAVEVLAELRGMLRKEP